MAFDVQSFDVAKFDAVLSRGLSSGLGNATGSMCIEAAICNVLGLPHGDDPGCVAKSVRCFKINLNDKNWSSKQARATGLRDLGLAQLGSLGVVSDKEFTTRLAEKIIRQLLPVLFRSFSREDFNAAADRCEQEGTKEAAWFAQKTAADAAAAYADAAAAAAAADAAAAAAAAAADAAAAAYAAAAAADAAADAADAAADAAAAAKKQPKDFYLTLAAKLALETLRELNSPGVSLL